MNIITYLFGLLLQRRVVLSCVIYCARFLYMRRILDHVYRKCIKVNMQKNRSWFFRLSNFFDSNHNIFVVVLFNIYFPSVKKKGGLNIKTRWYFSFHTIMLKYFKKFPRIWTRLPIYLTHSQLLRKKTPNKLQEHMCVRVREIRFIDRLR